MLMRISGIATAMLMGITLSSCSQGGQRIASPQQIDTTHLAEKDTTIAVGAQRLQAYLPSLKGKSVALAINHTSIIDSVHLIDTLQSLGVNIRRLFVPEHGYRGKEDAGKDIDDGAHEKLDVVSLYGKRYKPEPKHLEGIDIVVFDMQDVGARFYTYISTMTYIMEACAESNIKIIVLDRPNPNGHYVDGPVLEASQRSFVGLHPIPIVHGMTIGELAMMINEEGWLADSLKCELEVIKCDNYWHGRRYELPVRPSPNLPNAQSILLYPSLCLFEGTVMSVGRGTDFPFQVVGHPKVKADFEFVFTPRPTIGASKPKYDGKDCYGIDLRTHVAGDSLDIELIKRCYDSYKGGGNFFTNYFPLLAGNKALQLQIANGVSSSEIRSSWEPALSDFKSKRKQYLLYEDF